MANSGRPVEGQGMGGSDGRGSTAPGRPAKRRVYVVDREAQLRFALHLTLLLALGGILELGFAYVLWNMRDTLVTDVSAVLADPLLNLLPWFYVVVVLAVNLLVFVLIGMFYYHRIAGPALNIERSLGRIAVGDLNTRVRLRKGDHLQSIAAATDDLAMNWSEWALRLRERLKALEALPDPIDRVALRRQLEAIETELSGLRAAPRRESGE